MRVAFLGNFEVPYSSESHHAASLEELGHTVVRLQEPKCSHRDLDNAVKGADLFVWVHTHGWKQPGIEGVVNHARTLGVPVVAYHLDLYMGIQRWKQYESDPYLRQVDHFFTVDRLMADWLNENTSVNGHYLTAGVFGPECYMKEPGERFDVAFVGSRGYHKEWSYRPQLVDWLRDTYGHRFRHYGGDGLGTVRGDALNQVYADARVVVGDTLCLNFDYPDYWSDRVYETLGRGGFLIHPYILGMDRDFDTINNTHLVFYTYGDFGQLKDSIDFWLEYDDERDKIRHRGHEHVKANHTYKHRWQHILDVVCCQ